MLPLDQYTDLDAMEKDARDEGIVKTTQDYDRLSKIFAVEMLTRRLVYNITGYLKTHRSAGRADLYRRFRGDNHKLAFNDAMLRLLSSGHVQIEKLPPESSRGRKIETFIWSDKVIPNPPKYEHSLYEDSITETVTKDTSAQEIAPPRPSLDSAQQIASATENSSLIISDTQITHIDEFRNSEQTCYPANPEGRACKNIGESNDGSAGNAEGEPTLSGVGSTLSEIKTEAESAAESKAELKVQPPKPTHIVPSQTTTDKRFDW